MIRLEGIPIVAARIAAELKSARASETLQKEIVSKPDAMAAREGENMRPLTWIVIAEVCSGEWSIGGPAMTTEAVLPLGRRQ